MDHARRELARSQEGAGRKRTLSLRRRTDGFRRLRAGAGVATLLLAAGCVAVATQDAGRGESWHVSIEPRPEDVASIDGMVAAWYDIVSGPAGEPRNWSRDSTLYSPGVRFVIVGAGADGVERATVTDHGTFARESAPGFERNGFYEREIHRVTQRIGDVAYLLSTYEWRHEADGPVGGRGVNSISLFHDGTRWWITQAMWSDETPANPIPPELLPGS